MRRKSASVNSTNYVEQAVVQLFGLRVRTGSTEAQLRQFANKCIRQAIHSHKAPARYRGLDIHRLGSILRSWHKDSEYLTFDGLPRPLPRRGKRSLRDLVSQFYPTSKFYEVFRRLVDTKLIQQHRGDLWLPSGRTARIPQLSHETIEHLAEGVARYVETVTRNVTAKNERDVLFERSCKVTRLPKRDLLAFREYVDQQALSFLTSVDDWLEGKNLRSTRPRSPVCTAGVYTFAYVQKKKPGNRLEKY